MVLDGVLTAGTEGSAGRSFRFNRRLLSITGRAMRQPRTTPNLWTDEVHPPSPLHQAGHPSSSPMRSRRAGTSSSSYDSTPRRIPTPHGGAVSLAKGAPGPASCSIPSSPMGFVVSLETLSNRPHGAGMAHLQRWPWRASPDPAVRLTAGLQVTRRRSGTGRPAVAEDGRVRRPLPEPACTRPTFHRYWTGVW